MELDRIYHGDCFELAKGIPDGSIDLVVTDPPYGCTRNKWDKQVDLDKLWAVLKRVTKKNAAILIFANQPFTSKLVCSNLPMYRYELIWAKPQGTDFLNANRKPLKAHENIEVFYEKLPTYHKAGVQRGGYRRSLSHKGSKNWGKFHYQTVDNPSGVRCLTSLFTCTQQRSLHPTQKPAPLVEKLIKAYSNPGDTVLDLFMGSGTTAVAAMREGRHFIGFEQEQEYFDIACKRIEEERKGGK